MARELYEKVHEEWKDRPDKSTPVFGKDLMHIEEGIYKNSEDKALKEIYGDMSVNMGRSAGTSIAPYSVTLGSGNKATAPYSSAFGSNTTASGSCSHAEGYGTAANNYYSHAEGDKTIANGMASHAEGSETLAGGSSSHAEGYHTFANGIYQHVQGKYNISDFNLAHIVGNGNSDSDRSNAHTIDWNGNAWFAGTVESAGIILTDTVTEQKYILTIANGNLEITPVA